MSDNTELPLTTKVYNRTYLNRLPTADDGVEGLLTLADLFGTEEMFRFIAFMRAAGGGAAAGGKGSGSGIPGEARTQIARRMVENELGRGVTIDTADPDELERARVTVGRRLGYTRTTQVNLNKIIDGVTRRQKWTGE